MQQELLLKTAFYQVRHKHRRTWKKVLWVLSSIVVFVTTYALILPAITMEPDYICGMEAHAHSEDCYTAPEVTAVSTLICTPDGLGLHVHTNDCYDENGQPSCGMADFVLHSHEAHCYDADGELMCTLPEIKAHVHDEACWQQPHVHTELCYIQQRDQLLCTMEEGSVHTHVDTCFIPQDNLICTLAEIAPHTHTTEACFEETRELLCTEPEVQPHLHSASCYTEETTRVCGEEESENHTHTETCFETVTVLNCTMEETEGHLHGETCYAEPVYTLICANEETEGHTHSAVCYETVPVMDCALEENLAHVHTDACFVCTPVLQCEELTAEEGAVPVLVCEEEERFLHTHESACFDPSGHCVCGLLEIKEHLHGENCFAVTLEQAEEPVLSCGFEEHEHTEGCVAKDETESIPTTDQLLAEGYYCGIAEHSHASEYGCFTEEGLLMCTMTEHGHTWICELAPSDFTAVETAGEWEATLPQLQGRAAADLIAVAESQLGYEQSDINYIIENDEQMFYSRYADWWSYGEEPYSDWNAKFVSFCLEYAGITSVPPEDVTAKWPNELDNYGQWHKNDGEFQPIPADMVFFDTNGDDEADCVGIITYVELENNHMTVIHERNGKVRERDYDLDDADILGYTRIPGNEPVISSQPLPGEIILPETFSYEDEWLTLVLKVSGCAALPEGAVLPEGETQPEPTLTVRMLDDESDLYWQLMEAAQEHGEEGGLLGLTAMELQFRYGEYLLDTTACTITAQLTLKESLLAPPVQLFSLRAADPVPAPEAETGVEVAVIQADGTQITGTDTAFFETGAQMPTMTFAVTNNVIAVATTTTANPHFSVQYYANIPRVQWSNTAGTSGTLTIINTEGGNLPKNGQTIPRKYLRLDSDMTILRQNTLTEVYAEHDYEYITAPNLTYFNRLYENANYSLKEVWMLKSGRSADSTDPTDWEILDPDIIHFTNREESVSDTTILIHDGAVIRLVYDTTQNDYQNKVNFYDYDITDGKIYSSEANARAQTNPVSKAASGTAYYMKVDNLTATDQEGINLPSNYGSSGTKLAFGNDNTRVGLSWNTWSGQTLNKYNSNNADGGGCTFGIASTLEDGKINYANGITAPNLFDDGAANGKTEFPDCTLEFDRVGDTYTLKTVYDKSGNVIDSGLDTFIERWNWNNTKTIYANDFWPMDSAYSYKNNYVSGHDMKFGAVRNFHIFIGAPTGENEDGLEGNPESDDNIDHNAYFGMQYAVNFELTEDYIGPLEYLFFGDDDMWVFLTHPDGTSELICDIGGVHSSVGEYVNLWDYIEDNASGTHTLSFYYTERGASGSSCYMQFTLPSVSSATPEQSTGHLRVEKEVVGAVVDYSKEYHFDIKFTDAQGNRLLDEYSYTRYDKDGTVIKTDIILYDGGSFELRGGEYIIVRYLPDGAKYEITEANPDNSFVTTVNGEETNTATGTVEKMHTEVVTYTNTFYYELPETGGGGVANYRICGGLLMAVPLLWVLRRQRFRGRRATGG